jgi:hypothetical protein
MKTREEILSSQTAKDGYYHEQSRQIALLTEVLIDIRDLLNKNNV